MNKNLILSVCIPTYNGGDKLTVGLNVLKCALSKRDDFEVIVSDNCSTDNTRDILNKFYGIDNLFIYRNKSNLGFNGNIKQIIDKYASGKYCWIIGDDDYLDEDAIGKIIKFLKEESPSFVSVNYRLLNFDDFLHLKIENTRKLNFYKGSYFSCLDQNASRGNILGTFMSSQIFLLEPIKAVDKNVFGDNNWENFMQTFPNSYMMTTTFYNVDNCCAITTPILTALIHPKSWDDKMGKVYSEILPDYLDYCLNLSKDKCVLPKTRRLVSGNVIYNNIKEILKMRFENVRWRYFWKILDIFYIKK